ncbi:MAG: ABC transporter permease subunit [Victivallaceae bacterium]|jgi:ABC-type transport system involved in multi-copper enzyme maturation permease subunit
MLKISGIFEITVKKVKEPAFAILLVIAALIGACVSEMEALSFKQDSGLLFGLISLEQGPPLLAGFVVILLMTMIVAIFSGATDIPKDIESRIIMVVLTKPVKRIEYLIGKYLGITAICVCFFLTAAITASVVHWAKTGEVYAVSLLLRQLFLLLALFPLVALTIMISTFLPDISAMIVTATYVFFSLMISAISVFVDMLPKSLEIVSLIHVVAYFFPNFFYFFNSCKFSGIVLIALIAYSFSMTAIFLLIASFQMNRRDMI